MKTFITVYRGRDPETARPIFASTDPAVIRAVLRAIAERAAIAPVTHTGAPPVPPPVPRTRAALQS